MADAGPTGQGAQRLIVHLGVQKTGSTSIQRHLPATATQAEVEAVVDELNADPDCTGFLVQQPTGLDDSAILARVDPSKDVDGLNPVNLGNLVLGVSAEGKSLEDVATPLAARNAGTRRPGTRAEGAARPR